MPCYHTDQTRHTSMYGRLLFLKISANLPLAVCSHTVGHTVGQMVILSVKRSYCRSDFSLVLDQERVELTENPVYGTVSRWAFSPAHSLGVGVKWGRQKGRGPGLVAPGFGCMCVGGRLVVVWYRGKGSFWSVSPAHTLGVGVKWGRQKGRRPGLVAPGCVSVGGWLVVMWSVEKRSFWSEGSSGARGWSGCREASRRGSGWGAHGSASPVR